MNLKTKRSICLLVGIASILTIVGTISYAYFTAIAEMTPVQAGINTATVSARFSDYGEEVGGSLSFGESITKRFTIENTGTAEAKVRMYWRDLINTYLEGSLTYTLSYSENEEGPYTEVIGKTNVPQSKNSFKRTLANCLTIPVGKTYYYNLVITLNNLFDVDQTADLNAIFNSKFGIEDINYTNIIEDIMAATQGERSSFAATAITDEGVFEIEDDYGTSYYYRGAVENNYVKFAGFYWRIIRINGNGTMRIIYDGTTAHTNGESNNDRYTDVGQPFNLLSDDAKYVGWMYGPANEIKGTTIPSTSKEQAQTNAADSDIKKTVDAWYKTNIEDAGYGQYVSDTLFCNDRSTPGQGVTGYDKDTGLGYGKNLTGYGAYARFYQGGGQNYQDPKPTLKCSQHSDAFTVSDTDKGNGALEYPVGLITADEVVTAGSGELKKANNKYYLYKGSWYWSLSASNFNRTYGRMVIVGNVGGQFNDVDVGSTGAVAPVINLTPEYVETMVGDGTMENPYHVE